jgi:hypothetical protein
LAKTGETNHAKREEHEEFLDSDIERAPRSTPDDVLSAVSFGSGNDLIEALVSGQRILAWIEGETAMGRTYPGPRRSNSFF